MITSQQNIWREPPQVIRWHKATFRITTWLSVYVVFVIALALLMLP